MDSNGDYLTKYAGVGQETAPSIAFGAEPSTGVYLASPGSSSAYTISKRGTKRLRIDDDKTQIYGPIESDGMTFTGPLVLPDGSESRPSLAFETIFGVLDSGLFYDKSASFLEFVTEGKTTLFTSPGESGSVVPFVAPTLSTERGSTTTAALSSTHFDTGVYFPSEYEVGVTSHGINQVTFASTGSTFSTSITCPSITSTLVQASTLGVSSTGPINAFSNTITGGLISGSDLKDSSLTPSRLVESGTDSKLVSSSVTTSDLMPKSILFGDGSDGNVTISANTTLTRDMLYDTLTINSSAIVSTAGFRIYCKTALNGDGTGIIAFNGNSASGQTAGATASPGGLPAFGSSLGGGAGGNLSSTGSNGAQSSGPGGRGGKGGDATTGQTGGTQAAAPQFGFTTYYKMPFAITQTSLSGGCGGSGGAGSTTQVGGGGGAGGGRIAVVANTFTGTGGIVSIQANGGNGGSAAGATGGVGSGGGGGFVYVITRNVGSWVAASQISVTGGAPGVTGSTTNSVAASPGAYLVVTV